ncbi:hypothetical protein [Nocardioides sp.]|uniref:hypothetical protein n=1 Tax=Nocardioides sp. TaxID=35761 RepID=UPI002622E8D9|nr:hypothetical protein [Nocardioides sp.]
MRTRLLATSVAVLLALTLAGCSDDPQPIIEPAPSTTAAPSPEPTPSSTPTPEAETESAKDFIQRWQDEAFGMQVTGKTDAYLSMSADCESCESLADSVKVIYGAGGTIQLDGQHAVMGLQRVGKAQGTLIYEYELSSPASQVLSAEGKVEQEFSGGTNRYQVNVSRVSGQWSVTSASRTSA